MGDEGRQGTALGWIPTGGTMLGAPGAASGSGAGVAPLAALAPAVTVTRGAFRGRPGPRLATGTGSAAGATAAGSTAGGLPAAGTRHCVGRVRRGPRPRDFVSGVRGMGTAGGGPWALGGGAQTRGPAGGSTASASGPPGPSLLLSLSPLLSLLPPSSESLLELV